MSIQPGTDIGRYHILEQLGVGGMAVVYKAFDTRLEREVALKIIRTDRFAPDQLERVLKRFEREAKALARLDDQHIVKVHDFGEFEGSPYLVMQFVPGGSLQERTGRPMDWREAVQILLPVAKALKYAHAQGMVHRDVKPSNILISKDGRPILSDFGIAKVLEGEETQDLTATGTGIGTPEYMSPEQAEGKQVDGRSDIYSLGIVLYELVTGRKPFTADILPAVMIKQARDPLPDPKKYVPDLPQPVERFLYKALAKQPEDRNKNMADLAAALEILLHLPSAERDEEKARPLLVQTKERSRAVSRIKKADVGKPHTRLWARGAIILALVLFLVLFLYNKKDVLQTYIASATLVSTIQPAAIATAAPECKIAFTSNRDGNLEIYVMNADGTGVKNLTNNPNGDGNPAWSPDGSRIAFLSVRDGNHEIYVMNADGTGVKNLTNNPNGDGNPAWSPDGSRIAFLSVRDGNHEIYVMNADGTGVKKLTNNPAGDAYPAWSPDGSRIIFSSDRDGNEEIYVMNADGTGVKNLTNNPADDGSSAWLPDGSRVAFWSERDGNVEIYVMNADGTVVEKLTNNPAGDGYPEWSPYCK